MFVVRSAESKRTGSTDDPGRSVFSVRRDGTTRRARIWVLAPLAAEAVAAVDGLAARGTERDLGFLATGRARRLEHLAGCALVAAATTAAAVAAGATGIAATVRATAVRGTATLCVARSLAAGTAGGAATRLGEATLRVEVLLGRGEHEFLSTVRAGQILVVIQKKDSFSIAGAFPWFLAPVVRGVRVASCYVLVTAMSATDEHHTLCPPLT